jgi:uncharacterized protein (DUF2252 family)
MAEDEGTRPAERLPSVIPHKSEETSRALGKEARAKVPRGSHATFEPAPDRPDPVSLLEEQGTSRVPELVPIRYGRMLVSPFTFFRGAALIMASDLSTTPSSGLTTQVCGDAHLLNFGIFGTPERQLVFDCNDFDETHPGPWEWDIKRLAASIVVAGRHRGHSKDMRTDAIVQVGQAYRESMRQMATMSNLEVWYFHVDVAGVVTALEAAAAATGSKVQARMAATATKAAAKARTKDSMKALDKLTEVVGGEHRIINDPPLLVPAEDLLGDMEYEQFEQTFRDLLRRYRQSLTTDRRHLLEEYRFSQLARKVVGVGSVGTRVWVILMQGAGPEDVLFLQAKEAEASVLERFTKKSVYSNHGARVVAGQRLMQASSDIFLGWQRADGLDTRSHDYYVRQLQDWKGSIDTEAMIPQGLVEYGKLCGLTLARAHARSGDRFAMAAYLGNSNTFEKALAKFAESYADQNERDYEAFAGACKTGRLHAEEGL